MDIAESVLLPIDMQNGFDEPGWPARWNEKLDRNGIALLSAWRANGGRVIHVRHDSVQPGSTLTPGTPGNSFRPGFGPVNDEVVISKSVNAAFIGTDLDLRLRRLGVRALVVFGISTDMCVSTTVRVGANLGYEIILVDDACDCFDLPGAEGKRIAAKMVHDVHMATLGFEFASITTTRRLLDSIEATVADK